MYDETVEDLPMPMLPLPPLDLLLSVSDMIVVECPPLPPIVVPVEFVVVVVLGGLVGTVELGPMMNGLGEGEEDAVGYSVRYLRIDFIMLMLMPMPMPFLL
jgi:hypothetical protein